MTQSLGRILIVDDELPVLDVLGEYFSTQGYSVETAAGGADALAAVHRARPDLVLLDVRMPGMDGVEVLRRLRDLDRGLAIIMVTANEDISLARETLKLGAFDYVAKPFDFRYLDRVVAAGLVHAGGPATSGPSGEPADDPWKRLVFGVFRAVRAMPPAARASTGERLEGAALTAAREAGARHASQARQALAELELLLGIAADLGDLPTSTRLSIESTLGAARTSLASG